MAHDTGSEFLTDSVHQCLLTGLSLCPRAGRAMSSPASPVQRIRSWNVSSSTAQRDRRLSANVVLYTAILVQYRDIYSTRLGQADHYARTTYQASSMSRRGIHPLLMGLDKPKPKPHFKKQTDLSGYESAQRKRFLRAEIEEEKLAAAAGRRHLLKLERQVA